MLLIYVVYMGGALCALLLAGRLPDRAGFRPVLQGGLALALLGNLISLLACGTAPAWALGASWRGWPPASCDQRQLGPVRLVAPRPAAAHGDGQQPLDRLRLRQALGTSAAGMQQTITLYVLGLALVVLAVARGAARSCTARHLSLQGRRQGLDVPRF
ncbi:hypothetical protein [uncultured Azohydromonas sp.]|uniref:hypothetical protein n=1 Tax=uncultured Azohydromonas sp. TaxID=487342 RepID=UPI00262D5F2C|nr:hypothetical protein [uncultured Azohydromonas sp.]